MKGYPHLRHIPWRELKAASAVALPTRISIFKDLATEAAGTCPPQRKESGKGGKLGRGQLQVANLCFMAAKRFVAAATLFTTAAGALNAGRADAVLVFEFIQQGPDVALNVSGALAGFSSFFGTGGGGIGSVFPCVSIIQTDILPSTSPIYPFPGAAPFG
ncbi:MAG: hypothetical protein ACKOYH_02120, partial [Cyanobium sp.]